MTMFEFSFLVAMAAPFLALVSSLVLKGTHAFKWNSLLLAMAGAGGTAASVYAVVNEVPFTYALPIFYSTSLVFDRFSAIFFLAISIVLFAVGVFSSAIGDRLKGVINLRVLGLFTAIFVIGVQWTLTAGNIIGFLSAWGLMTLATFAMILTDATPAGQRSAFRFLSVALVGMGMLTAGFFMLTTGALFVGFDSLQTLAGQVDTTTLGIAFGLILAGLLSLVTIAPAKAPSTSSALLFGSMTSVSLYVFIRCILFILPPLSLWFALPVLILGSVLAIGSLIVATKQTDMKRLLAWASDAVFGTVLLTMGCAMMFQSLALYEAMNVALFATFALILANAFATSGLFLSAGVMGSAYRTRDMNSIRGIALHMPKLTMATLVLCLSAASLPLVGAFSGKWMIVTSVISSVRSLDMPMRWGMMGIFIAFAAIVALSFKVMTTLFATITFGGDVPEQVTKSSEPENVLLIPISALALCSVTLFFALPRLLEAISAGPMTDVPGTFQGGVISSNVVLRPVVLAGVLLVGMVGAYLVKRFVTQNQKPQSSVTPELV